jgi:hypothetical protein
MGAGIATLLAPPANDAWTMGLTFGMIHLVYGAAVAAVKHTPLSRIAILRDFC